MSKSILPTPLSWDVPRLEAFRKRHLGRQAEELNTGWKDVLVAQGLILYGLAWNDDEALAWGRAWLKRHLEAGVESRPDYLIHLQPATPGVFINTYCGNWGFPHAAGPMAGRVSDPRLREAIVGMCEEIADRAVRLKDGVISYNGVSEAARTRVWVDTLYYACGALAQGFAVTGERRYAEEAIRQCLAHARYLRDESTGLFFHDADPQTLERSQWFWARGNGWAIMALADTLAHCPREMDGWRETLEIYRSMVTGLLRLQHSCGLWRVVPECAESHLETSGSAMIAVGIAVGIRHGWIERAAAGNILRAFRELTTWIHPESGALLGAQAPAACGGWETHKLSPIGEYAYATGAFFRLLAEVGNGELPG